MFTIWVSFIAIYHDHPVKFYEWNYLYISPMTAVNNYSKFLLLLPLLMISVKEKHLIRIIYMCTIGALLHVFLAFMQFHFHSLPRYPGTSSIANTYGSMCATFSIISVYYYFTKKNKSVYLLFSAVIFFGILILTQTRGPVIGIALGLTYLIIAMRSRVLLTFACICLLSLIVIPNPLAERLKETSSIFLGTKSTIKDKQLRTGELFDIQSRMFYYRHGIQDLKKHYFLGVGPQHLGHRLRQVFRDEVHYQNRDGSQRTIYVERHLHNEFLDISVKFGLLGLLLLLLIYYSLYKASNNDNRVLMNLILIMLLATQLTQCHFLHQQPTLFFITLLFLNVRPKMIKDSN
tara:strand:- start:1435 stop:2475 length:1041 start_codon:yes stop_codon:yes gene_type:complete